MEDNRIISEAQDNNKITKININTAKAKIIVQIEVQEPDQEPINELNKKSSGFSGTDPEESEDITNHESSEESQENTFEDNAVTDTQNTTIFEKETEKPSDNSDQKSDIDQEETKDVTLLKWYTS